MLLCLLNFDLINAAVVIIFERDFFQKSCRPQNSRVLFKSIGFLCFNVYCIFIFQIFSIGEMHL